MVVKELRNKMSKGNKLKSYSFPKEWINIMAIDLADAMKKKAILLSKKTK